MALTTNSNHTVLRGGGQGGHLYTGVEPIVVNNQEYKISANTAALGVESPLYFSVDTPTQTVISFSGDGQPYSAGENVSVENHIISGKDWTPELDEKLDITAYEQGDTAFYTAGSNIDITEHVISGKDWNPEINNASSYALSEAINQMQGYPSGVDNITPDIVTSYISGGLLHISAKDWADDISAASAMATAWTDSQGYLTAEVEYSAGNNIDITNHVISVTGSVPSADKASTAIYTNSANSATYDGDGNNIANTYLKVTSYKEYTAGPNIDITNHVISGRDWEGYIRNIVQSGDATAYNAATAWVYNQGYLTGDYIPVSAMGIDTPMPGMLTYITGFSGSGISARVAAESFTALKDSDGRNLTALLANSAINSADGYVTGINGTPISGVGGQGVEYEGILPIVVNNVEHKISAQSARLGVQEPLYLVEDSETATVIGISGLPEIEGVMYESALNFGNGYITGYNSSALSSERSRYAVSSTSANGAISSQSAAIVTGGWETANGKITGYNGTAFNAGAGNTYDVKASSNISVATAGNTFTVSGKDWTNTITAASSHAVGMAAVQAAGWYIPYQSVTTGDSGTLTYNVNRGIRVTATSGWTEIYGQNKENENEAHLQVGQNYADGHSFWAELDGAGSGFLQMNWNSGTISPNSHSSYSNGTTAAMSLGNGALVYRSANSALTSLDDESSKVWQIGSERVRIWNQWGSASFGPRYLDVVNTAEGNYWSMFAADSAARLRVYGSAGNGTRGAVDIAPGYINFYNEDWSLNQTLNTSDISALKALLNHVKTASANW